MVDPFTSPETIDIHQAYLIVSRAYADRRMLYYKILHPKPTFWPHLIPQLFCSKVIVDLFPIALRDLAHYEKEVPILLILQTFYDEFNINIYFEHKHIIDFINWEPKFNVYIKLIDRNKGERSSAIIKNSLLAIIHELPLFQIFMYLTINVMKANINIIKDKIEDITFFPKECTSTAKYKAFISIVNEYIDIFPFVIWTPKDRKKLREMSMCTKFWDEKTLVTGTYQNVIIISGSILTLSARFVKCSGLLVNMLNDIPNGPNVINIGYFDMPKQEFVDALENFLETSLVVQRNQIINSIDEGIEDIIKFYNYFQLGGQYLIPLKFIFKKIIWANDVRELKKIIPKFKLIF